MDKFHGCFGKRPQEGGSDDPFLPTGPERESEREAGGAQNNFSLCGDLSENKLPLELHRGAAAANMTPGLRNTRSPADKSKKGVKITSCQRTLKLIFMHSERDRL